MSSAAAQLQVVMDALPPLADGHVRLYRIQSAVVATVAPWIQAAHQADGTALARGRWFTRDPQALAFYLDDTAQPELVTLDLPETEAWACRLSRLPAVLPDGSRPRAFSRDSETEHFVAKAALSGVQCWTLDVVTSPDEPRTRRRGPN